MRRLSNLIAAPLVTKGDKEYHFFCDLLWLKYLHYPLFSLFPRLTIDSEEMAGVSDEELRFEVTVSVPDGSARTLHDPKEATDVLKDLRERWAGQSIRVKAWHWQEPIALPPWDGDRIEPLTGYLRVRQEKAIEDLEQAIVSRHAPRLESGAVLRGLLDGLLKSGLDFSSAGSEHEVANMVLAALGKPPQSSSEPWFDHVVFEFADGGPVILVYAPGAETHAVDVLGQEERRRRGWGQTLDGYFRRKRADDILIQYVPPPPPKPKGRPRKQISNCGIGEEQVNDFG